MAVSLEARAPLLDPGLVSLAFAIPGSEKVRHGRLKHVFKEALRGVVPDEVLARPKRGFALPVAQWLRDGMRHDLLEALDPVRLRREGVFEPGPVTTLVRGAPFGRARPPQAALHALHVSEVAGAVAQLNSSI